MADGSTIEWLNRPGTRPASWNPIRAFNKATGKRGWFCVHVHEGCKGCYAERQNVKAGDTGGNGIAYRAQNRELVDIILHEPTLLQPLKWKSPRTIFVCSMADLYGAWVKDAWLDKIKAVQALTPQHTYIELTKRPERMREYSLKQADNLADLGTQVLLLAPRDEDGYFAQAAVPAKWPLPNVWGLVSCSTQEDADAFIAILLQTPLALRGVSAEPLLGPMDLTDIPWPKDRPTFPQTDDLSQSRSALNLIEGVKLDWVIVGGESGKDARPMHPAWARSLRDQCATAGVPYFYKQWGEWAPHKPQAGGDLGGDVRAGRVRIVHPTGQSDVEVSEATGGRNTIPGSRYMARVGKKAAGRLLDGVEHNAFPEVRTNGESHEADHRYLA